MDKGGAGAGWLDGGGEMGKVVRATDWSRTPLGPIESWPQSLRTAASLCLASNFPISLAWGPGRVQIYNDGYWPICGAKHPESMGQDFKQCWFSAWPAIGEAFESACAGRAAFLENQRMFLDRNGYLEETFFTFSFSPIRDETGGVGGLFHPVTELTQQTLAERRLTVLRDIAERASEARGVESAAQRVAQILDAHELDLPFVLLYLVQPDGKSARLAGSTGLAPGSGARPASVGMETGPWPFAQAAQSRAVLEAGCLETLGAPLACRPYPEPPKTAFVMPINAPGLEWPLAMLVGGASARRAVDEPYRAFFAMLREAVTGVLVNARAYEEEKKRAEALAEIDRAKTLFFSNVSHEFRTPLTLMLGPAEDALADAEAPLAPAQRERLELVHRNALRLQKLVNTLLEFSRIEAGRVQASYEPADLAAVTAELASNFRSACERAGIGLEIDCPPLDEPVYVDREMWERIVLNLLSNAFKFTHQGSIGVSLARVDSRAVLTVRDTGIGIPQAEQPHLFERFHRVQGARGRTHEGTGIGLALAHELVKLHGGSVRAQSTEGEGSAFTVELPLGTAHLPGERVKAAGSPVAAGASAAAYIGEALGWLPAGVQTERPADFAGIDAQVRSRVLIADDNADMREYLRKLLAARYEVETAGDGAQALAAVRARAPHLVLADVMMPNLDGLALARALRADPRTRAIPVILLSARVGEESRIEGLDAGADDYLYKPFSARELLASVAARLELARERERAQEELRGADRHKDEFIAMLAHELRNPLAALGLSAEILESADIDDRQGRFAVAAIGRQRMQMQRLVDDLLDVARVTFGKLALQRRPVDLLAETRSVVSDHVRQESGARIEVAGRTQWADGDPVRVRQMISNLVDNALRYGGRNIRVRVAAAGDLAQVSVQDDGQGFAPGALPALLKPFVQGKQPLDRGQGGLGLGLALVHRLAALHGGTLQANSGGPGQGAAFTISLPRAQRPRLRAAKPGPAVEPVPRRVLVVEDEADTREALRILLEMRGHKVSVAADGAEGLAKLGSFRPHVALVDIGLPGMDGYELARRARDLPGGKRVTLIAITGYGLDRDRQKAVEAGFDLHLIKPVSYQQLARAFGGGALREPSSRTTSVAGERQT